MLDQLERRRLFSQLFVTGTPAADSVSLTVAGSTSAGIDVYVKNAGTAALAVKVDGTAVQLAAGKTIRTSQIVAGVITQISVDLGDGDDKLATAAAVTVPMTVVGGGGNDTLAGGSGNDLISADAAGGSVRTDFFAGNELHGGAGNDTLVGGANTADALYGGDGQDSLTANYAADLYGEAGNDTLKAGAGVDPDGYTPGSALDGGAGNDSLVGNAYDDALTGGTGNDTLVGNAGDDFLDGGDGSDTLTGGRGDDTYEFFQKAAAAETDRITEYAGEGNDLIAFDGEGRTGVTSVGARVDLNDSARLVETGSRRVIAPAGLAANLERVRGGPYADTIYGNAAANDLSAGNNVYFTDDPFGGVRPTDENGPYPLDDTAADFIDGRGGADTLTGNGPDTLSGGDGDDTLDTYDVNDAGQNRQVLVLGGNGVDTQRVQYAFLDTLTMQPTLENLTVIGGTTGGGRIDHIIGNALNNAITLDASIEAYLGGIAFANVGTVSGGEGNDTILSAEGDSDDATSYQHQSEGTHTFEGDGGNDLLVGHFVPGTVGDTLYLRGGAGVDTLQATGGTAWADFSDRTGGLRIDVRSGRYTGANGDAEILGPGATNVRGTGGNDTIVGDARDNVIDGGAGNDDITGGGGRDAVTYADRTGSVVAKIDGLPHSGVRGERDLIRTDIAGLIGGAADDTLVGGANDDTLDGGGGSDLIDGGAGDDRLIGLTYDTADTIIGNAGEDTVAQGDNSAADTSFRVSLDGVANDGQYDRFGGDAPGGNVLSVENVDGADYATGDDGPNELTNVGTYASGGGGNDLLTESPNSLIADLDGGTGADTIQGGVADYRSRTAGVAVSLNGKADDGETGERDQVLTDPNSFVGRSFIYGGQGNDTLVGSDGDDEINGLGGNDSISGAGGNDVLAGGVGGRYDLFDYHLADQFAGYDGNDTFSGGDGTDTLSYATRGDNLRISLDGLANDGASGERDNAGDGADIELVASGTGNDSLVGGANGSNFYGNEGADTFVGGAGADSVLYGLRDINFNDQSGVTVTLDDAGNDGAPGEHDNVRSSIDRVVGTGSADKLAGGVRPATLDGDDGFDTLYGGSADDTLVLRGYGTLAYGLGGDDTFVNQNGTPDTIDGGDGFDSVQDDDVDLATPGAQNDQFANVEYVYDTIDGAAPAAAASAVTVAPTALVSGAAVDAKKVLRVTGTDSADAIYLSQSNGKVTVQINGSNKGSFATTTFKVIAITAGNGNDTVKLSTPAGKDTLTTGARVAGGAGNDTIIGGASNDQLAGEAGNDSVDGGAGNDVLSGDFIVFKGDTVPSAARGADGRDTIVGGTGSGDIVSYTYRAAGVTLDTNGAAVSGAAGEGDSVRGVEFAVGGRGGDVLKGSAANDLLFGGEGGDTLGGGGGANRLYGGDGIDSLNPSSGGDFVDSGADNDLDRIVGKLDAKGVVCFTASGLILSGQFNGNDYFTISGRKYGTAIGD